MHDYLSLACDCASTLVPELREQSRLSAFYQAKSADNRPAKDRDSGGFGAATNTSSICVEQKGPSDKPLHIPLV